MKKKVCYLRSILKVISQYCVGIALAICLYETLFVGVVSPFVDEDISGTDVDTNDKDETANDTDAVIENHSESGSHIVTYVIVAVAVLAVLTAILIVVKKRK